jgi:hypothetical protein
MTDSKKMSETVTVGRLTISSPVQRPAAQLCFAKR